MWTSKKTLNIYRNTKKIDPVSDNVKILALLEMKPLH